MSDLKKILDKNGFDDVVSDVKLESGKWVCTSVVVGGERFYLYVDKELTNKLEK